MPTVDNSGDILGDKQIRNAGDYNGLGGGGFVPIGTARLTRVDATQVQLGLGVIPLKVGGSWALRAVSSALVINNTGLAASTRYYLYAADDGHGSTVLTFSATGHATDTDFGVEVKSDDAASTLVGMVLTDGSSQFTDFLVLSFFARKPKVNVTHYTALASTAQSTYDELDAAIRNTFLTWADEAVGVTFVGSFGTDVPSKRCHISLAFDGITPEDIWTMPFTNSHGIDDSGWTLQTTLHRRKTGLSEVSHYATVIAKISANTTARIQIESNTAGERSTLAVEVVG